MDENAPNQRPSRAQLSKTPSWVMLGFLLGAAFVWLLPRREEPARPIVMAPPPAEPATAPEVPRLTTVEAVFDQWSEYAVWDHDTTQIALWNSATRAFDDYYEVRRIDGSYYFRSIPVLTNRIIRHGKPLPTECPLRFTETQEQYDDWRQNDRFERPAERPVNYAPRVERPAVKPDATPQPSNARP